MSQQNEYERARDETIRRNKELLQSLLKGVSIAPINKKTPTKASRPSKPNPTGEKRVKATVKAVKRTPSSGIRSSARQAGQKATDYGNDLLSDGEFGEEDSDGGFSDDDSEAEGTDEAEVGIGKKRKAKRPVQRKVKSLKGNRPDPKVFGEQRGSPVGSWWPMRIDCSQAGVHAPTVAGMSGHSEEGAWSICLSGGYPEDVDLGYVLTYTGCGGRDLKGSKDAPKNLRTAPQSSDQTFDNPLNRALQVSAETQKPVRIVRGFKNPSPFAPETGYRYDGLYVVNRAWLDVGLSKQKYKVCRFALTRLPCQPPIKIHPERQSEADKVLGGLGMDFNAPSTTAIAPPSSSSSDSAEEALTPIVEKTLFQASPWGRLEVLRGLYSSWSSPVMQSKT